MPVPEAAVNEDRRPVARKNQIRSAGNVFRMQPEPEPLTMQAAADQTLRLSVTAADAAHHAASGGRIHDIGHYPAWASSSGCTIISPARNGLTACATSWITGTTTELPNCW